MPALQNDPLREALALVPDAAVAIAAGGEIVAANAQALEMFGCGEAGMLGRLAEGFLSIGPALDAVVGGSGAGRVGARLEGRRSNGVPFPLEASLRAVDCEGVRAVVCSMREPDATQLADEAQRYFDVAFDNAPIGMALFNSDGQYVRVNATLCRMLGRSEPELLGRRDQEFTHPDDRRSDVDAAWEILEGKRSTHQCEKRFVRPDGSVICVIASLTFLRDERGRPLSWVGQFADITDRRAAEEALRDERDLAHAIIAAMPQGIGLTRGGAIVAVNDALCRLTGFSREELVGARVPFPFWPDEALAEATSARDRVVQEGGGDFELTLQRKDGTRFHASLTATAAVGPDGSTLGFVTTIRDVSERKRHEEELTRRAASDGLTGLLNREAFHDQLRAEAVAAAERRRPLSLALLDLDNFKAINDRFGHPAGDRVLIEAAARLRTVSRGGDHLARIGGEEFAWIMPGADGVSALAAGERARIAIANEGFEGVGRATLSVGVCELADAADPAELYRLADVALYNAKASGRDRCVRHTAGDGPGGGEGKGAPPAPGESAGGAGG